MRAQTLVPDSKYLNKLRLVMVVIAFSILLAGVLLGWVIGRDDGPEAFRATVWVTVIATAACLLPGMFLAGAYYRSLRYEIRDDEVIVSVGIWTKSIKHVPFRTVTNIKINRDIFDRWFFSLGSLNIQTAGMSGTKGAEEALVGLPNVNEIYEIVGENLRRFRGGMAPTAAEVERGDVDTLNAILAEVRAIRKGMEK